MGGWVCMHPFALFQVQQLKTKLGALIGSRNSERAYTLGLCVLYSDSGFWGWVPPIRLCGHQLEVGFSPSGQKMLRAGQKPAPLCVRDPPGMLWAPLPMAPLVEACTLLPGGLPLLPMGLNEASTGLGSGDRALLLPCPLPSSSSPG